MSTQLNVGFVGNPNCGKTTLFNAYTGANLKVANWPGVTVEKKEGKTTFENETYRLIDLPGIYSLSSYTIEESVSRDVILSDDIDVIVNVVDASSLERNLYLTLQLIELGKPVVVALNMMDIVKERGMELDLHRLPEMIGVPTIPVSATKKRGLSILMHAVAHHKDKKTLGPLVHHHGGSESHPHDHHREYAMVYSDEIEDKIDILTKELKKIYPDSSNYRWLSLKYLEADKKIKNQYPLSLPPGFDEGNEKEIIKEKYDFIEEIVDEVVANKSEKTARTDKIDHYLTSKWLGLPIFLGVMALVFFFTFTIGDWLKGYFEIGLEAFSDMTIKGLTAIHTSPLLTSLLVDGIIGGVGGILTFLPNIVILFIALAFLEDSGYMARVAFVMDDIMSFLGLSGRAFLPMVLGFGCTVPAVMATRALETKKDRVKTILVTPFMSCSAKLPVYVLFSSMFFGRNAMFVSYSLYVLGIALAIVTSFVLSKIDGTKATHSLLIELPEYKSPNIRTITIYVWEKVKDYLTKAGTVIFVASILLWILLNFGMTGYVTDVSQSLAASIGKILVPVFKPTGLGHWQIIVALIAGLAAKEVVVSSISVLFSVSNATTAAGMSTLITTLSGIGFGSVNAYALMVFVLLYIPCTAAVATIHRELKSTKTTLLIITYQLAVAWFLSFLIFQIGSRIF
ncbi:ferrous iron transport protein B [Aequitasia blattaphilus]|uniref:Ferrous iron transport protein B n=1 Tax=Aequitasia blattaphilus TaxID=2949332 RepID=A0ABT1E6M7_9FIRM|nr:ferrous iron transport protein B [Aequitasia blattaphilus]MCP1101485.1 ferrous iron transport protein B [Aequitasia blattaphilus]MCR8614125.1 ferrous iron transport protein B [Aequitasia blattaphilus]